MIRPYNPESGRRIEHGYTPEEIEEAISEVYQTRDSYLDKMAKVALHLSLHTRTGRVSFTFQNAIFKREKTGNTSYLYWLFTKATEADTFPELYRSGEYLNQQDRLSFEAVMNMEHEAILKGLNTVVRKCCDSKVCSIDEMSDSYNEVLFRRGSVFEGAAQSVCLSRKIPSWIPPQEEVAIPDTKPLDPEIMAERQFAETDRDLEIAQEAYILLGSLPQTVYDKSDPPRDSLGRPIPIVTQTAEEKREQKYRIARAFQEIKAKYVSQRVKADIDRNFGSSGQITCFDVSNLVHNLAVLPKNSQLELPWDGSLLQTYIQEELFLKFATEISMRRYYLASLKKTISSSK